MQIVTPRMESNVIRVAIANAIKESKKDRVKNHLILPREIIEKRIEAVVVARARASII